MVRKKKHQNEQPTKYVENFEKKKREGGPSMINDMKCQNCGGQHPTFKCRKNDKVCYSCGSKDHFIRNCLVPPKPDVNPKPQN